MAHKTVTVQPRNDGRDFQQSWETKSSKGDYDASTTKEAAINQAREWAHQGDTLVVKKTNGQMQEGYPRTVRDSTPYDDDDSDTGSKHGVDIPLGPTDYGEDTMDSAFPW